jgi:hypothetical protein
MLLLTQSQKLFRVIFDNGQFIYFFRSIVAFYRLKKRVRGVRILLM